MRFYVVTAVATKPIKHDEGLTLSVRVLARSKAHAKKRVLRYMAVIITDVRLDRWTF